MRIVARVADKRADFIPHQRTIHPRVADEVLMRILGAGEVQPVEMPNPAVCAVASDQPWSADRFFPSVGPSNRCHDLVRLLDEGQELGFALHLDAVAVQQPLQFGFGLALFDADGKWNGLSTSPPVECRNRLPFAYWLTPGQLDAAIQKIIDDAEIVEDLERTGVK